MPIEEILDQLDELIDRSWSLPLTGGRCVVDADKVRELLDDVRLNLPTEIRQAQSIVADRTAIVEEAKKEVGMVVEGISAVDGAYTLARKYDVETPIINEMYAIIHEGKSAKEVTETLMTRGRKEEM